MPFGPGNQAAKGRSNKHDGFRALVRSLPIKDKRKIIETAVKAATNGDVRWAEWLWKVAAEAPVDGQTYAQMPGGLLVPIKEVLVERIDDSAIDAEIVVERNGWHPQAALPPGADEGVGSE